MTSPASPATDPRYHATVAPHPDADLLGSLQNRFDSALSQALHGATEVALVNFPNHGNPGDSAIWLGAEAALRRLNVRVAYRCAWYNFSPYVLRHRLPDAPVLINGGGNFGDLYGGQQSLRERIFKTERQRSVIQLPQSVHFTQRKNLERNRKLIGAHPQLTLLLRDQQSFDFATETFDAPTILAPDSAFGLGELPRVAPALHGAPRPDILWLHRLPSDPEYVDYGIAAATSGIPQSVTEVEWLKKTPFEPDWSRAAARARRRNERLRPRAAASPRWARFAWRPLAATFDPLGWGHVTRGLAILRAGRVLVTDKLHGHIMALAAGIPHVVLNNSYGKVAGAYRTWTHPSTLAHWAENGEHAVDLALQLLAAADLGEDL